MFSVVGCSEVSCLVAGLQAGVVVARLGESESRYKSVRRVVPISVGNPTDYQCWCAESQDDVLRVVSFPNCVREVSDHCFAWCCSLRVVVFGVSSLLERIGVDAFR